MLSVVTLSAILAGCAAGRVGDGAYLVRGKGYRVSPPPGWERIASDADLALRQPATGAGMMAHATCDGKTARRPLPILARHLRFGLDGVGELHEAPVEVAGHAAVQSRFQARLGGRPVAVEAVTVGGPGCVYDLAVVAPPDRLEEVRPDFARFVASLALPGAAGTRP